VRAHAALIKLHTLALYPYVPGTVPAWFLHLRRSRLEFSYYIEYRIVLHALLVTSDPTVLRLEVSKVHGVFYVGWDVLF